MFRLALLFTLIALIALPAQAAVWETTKNWNDQEELRYSDWVRTSWKTDVFRSANSPYRGLAPDCADTVYSMRAIYAFENGLPFAMVDPSTQRSLITNDIQKFDGVTAGPRRLVAFLNWAYSIMHTSSLPNDTYPVAITRSTVRPGGLMLAKESKHSYTIKKLQETGVPTLYYSTQGNDGDLKVRSWPSVGYLFSEGIKEPSGIRDFRQPQDLLKPVWEVPGYSREQYAAPAKKWVSIMQAKLSRREETGEESLKRHMADVCQLVQTRIDLVKNADRKLREIGDRCMTASEYDDLSTPSRDGQTQAAFLDLWRAFKKAVDAKQKINDSLKEQLWNIFQESQNDESENQYCVVKYGKNISLGEFRRRLFSGMISSNPNDPWQYRWGEVRGPSERGRRCPKY